MGVFDNMKDKASELVDQHGDQVGDGVDKAGLRRREDRRPARRQIDQGSRGPKNALDGLDGQDDDIP